MPYQRPEIMLIKHSRSKKPIKIMDPDCAICSQPALAQCECEVKGLDIAVRQAEQRMMTSVFNDIRYVSAIPIEFDKTTNEQQGLGPRPCPGLHPLLLLHAHDAPQRTARCQHPPHDRARSVLFPRPSSPRRNRRRRRRAKTRNRRRLESLSATIPRSVGVLLRIGRSDFTWGR